MELRSESVEVQVDLLSKETPIQKVCVSNEGVALISEVVTERPDFVEVEKRTVIQRIINEKIVIPKPPITADIEAMPGQTLTIDSRSSLFCFESGFPDSQGSGAMEIASQESSLESKMDISSYESVMDYSSQEIDAPYETITETVNTNKVTCDGESVKENSAPPTGEAEVSSTSDQPLPVDVGEHEYSESHKENYCFPGRMQEYREGNRGEGEYPQRGKSFTEFKKRRLSEESLLLSREEAIKAREEACKYREKALKKREAAFEDQKEFVKECVNHSSKRSKLENDIHFL